MSVPHLLKRGAFIKGSMEFKSLLSSYMRTRRHYMEREIRKMVTQKLNEERRSIHKIVVTDHCITLFDKHDKLITEL